MEAQISYVNIQSEKDFHLIFREYYQILVNFACRYTNDKQVSKDLVQDVFVKLWEKRKDFDCIKNIKNFLFTTVRNKCYNYLRDNKLKKHVDVSNLEALIVEFSIENEIIKEEVLFQVHQLYKHLTPQQQKIFSLSSNGLKAKEIAEELNIGIETIKTQKKRAKKIISQLREKII